MGEVLLEARTAFNDTTGTTRDVAIAEGPPIEGPHGGMLTDGDLTRAELEHAVKLTAEHTHSGHVGYGQGTAPPTFFIPEEYLPVQWASEGWGVVAERTGANATDIVFGQQPLPSRPLDQRFADADEANREALWGPAVAP